MGLQLAACQSDTELTAVVTLLGMNNQNDGLIAAVPSVTTGVRSHRDAAGRQQVGGVLVEVVGDGHGRAVDRARPAASVSSWAGSAMRREDSESG